jgi:hypothetical protein
MDTNQSRREQEIMEIKCKMIKELPDGSAIITIDLDEDAKEFLISEGFLAVVKRSLASSESYVPKEKAKKK